MTATPTISIGSLYCKAADVFWVGPGAWPNPLSVPPGATVRLNMNAAGAVTTTFSGTTTAGSFNITGVASLAGLAIGQPLTGPGLQTDSFISGFGTATVAFSNGGAAGPSGVPQPASATGSGTFAAADPWPIGSLAVSVSPATGVNIADYNFDGGTDPDHIGTGLAISNYPGMAIGGVDLSFSIYSARGRVHGGETARGGIHGVPLKSWTRTSRPSTPCLRAVCR